MNKNSFLSIFRIPITLNSLLKFFPNKQIVKLIELNKMIKKSIMSCQRIWTKRLIIFEESCFELWLKELKFYTEISNNIRIHSISLLFKLFCADFSQAEFLLFTNYFCRFLSSLFPVLTSVKLLFRNSSNNEYLLYKIIEEISQAKFNINSLSIWNVIIENDVLSLISNMKSLLIINLCGSTIYSFESLLNSNWNLTKFIATDLPNIECDCLIKFILKNPTIKYLGFYGEEYDSSDFLKIMSSLPPLASFKILHCQNFDQRSLSLLKIVNLKTLSLKNCENKLNLREKFGKDSNLKKLELERMANLTNMDLIPVIQSNLNISILRISWNNLINDEAIEIILQTLSKLILIDISGNKKITEKPFVNHSSISLRKIIAEKCDFVDLENLTSFLIHNNKVTFIDYYGETYSWASFIPKINNLK